MTRRLSDARLWDLSPELQAKGPRPKEPRKRSREESIMQIALLKWWQVNCRVFGVPELCLFSIPNGGGRSGPIVGSIMKAEGLRKGAPDLFLAHVRLKNKMINGAITPDSFAGLFLELKRRDGVLSPEQEVFHEILRKQGYQCAVCWSLQECIDTITAYLTQ